MGRKILSMPLDLVLEALCRDDRVAVRAAEAAGLDPALAAGKFVVCDGMPADARIVGVRSDPVFTNTLEMVIESAEWPDVPAGCVLTRMDVWFTQYTSYQTYREMTAKPKPAAPDETWEVPKAWLTGSPMPGVVSDGTYSDAVAKQSAAPGAGGAKSATVKFREFF